MAGLLYADYNGQSVDVSDSQKAIISNAADSWNKLTGSNMTAQEYDAQANPTTYGARWGVAPTQTQAPSSEVQQSGLLGASTPTQTPTAVGYTPSAATASTAGTTNYTTSNADAVKALAQGYTSAPTTVTPESTSAFQLNKILADDSPLKQQAETYGLQQANKRGLLNSSIATGAAYDSVIHNSLPLATQDANTYANANAATAASENAARQFGAGAQNTAELQNAQLGTQVNLTNATEKNKAEAANAGEANQNSRQNAQLGTQVSMANAGYTNDASKFGAQATNAASLAAAENQTKLNMMQIDKDTKLKIASMGEDSQAKIEQIKASNGQLLQTNTNAASMFNQYVTNLASISNNTNMDATAKQAAMDNQLASLNAGLQAIGSISGLNLSQYFQAEGAAPVVPVDQTAQPTAQQVTDSGGGE